MKCVDLFSGCGGLSLGFQNSGFEILAAFDKWEKAVKVYSDNFEHDVFTFDLSDVNKSVNIIKKYNPEAIIGGPPCQDFSSAGKRDESLGRADLTYSFADIVSSVRPSLFVMENVERIKGSQILLDVVSQFSNIGYGLTPVILNAAYCGVPQLRKRFFLIGHLSSPHGLFQKVLLESMGTQPMTLRDYFGDSLGLNYYYRHPRNYTRRGIYSVDEPSPTVRGVNRPVPPNYKRHKADSIEADLANLRPLTTIERSYIQTFPKTFKFIGTKTNLEQMVGNAVPVKLAEFVAKAILESLAVRHNTASGVSVQLPIDKILPRVSIPDKVLLKI